MGSKHEGCTCEKCQECCRREPGWFIPEEVPQAAKYLGVNEKEFIKKFCVEHYEDNIYALSPTTKPKSTECIFLNLEGLCDIQPVKPYECRKIYGCEGPHRHRRMREIIKRMWR